jgi:hypothetical protein
MAFHFLFLGEGGERDGMIESSEGQPDDSMIRMCRQTKEIRNRTAGRSVEGRDGGSDAERIRRISWPGCPHVRVWDGVGWDRIF